MEKFEKMVEAARGAMVHVLDLAAADRVLVVTDQKTRLCGDAFSRAAERVGCPVAIYVIEEAARPLQAVPGDLREALQGADVVINAVAGDDREVPFRIEWIQAIEDRGCVRLGHSPGIDMDMMIGGPLNVDYGDMIERARRLMDAFAGAVSVHITAPAGTDLTLDLTGREFVTDVKATVEAGSNLPCGEIYCCPVETGADGTLVIDGCFGAYGNVPAPVTMKLIAGQVVDVTSDNDAVVAAIDSMLDIDEGARTIAELGIGLNPGARLTPRMLEAEKAGRTAHIAFGSNEGMPGGKSVSKIHIDYLFKDPTMVATWSDGAEREILRDGVVL